jgi:glucosamine--fructose-6-phosphate aminotransferase (isomerizing)
MSCPPHSSHNVSVVHKGIIENSTILKKYLINKGHKFKSQTDTEVIVHLITENLKTHDLEEAITNTLKQLHGSFALGIIFKDIPDLIVGARRGSPLAVGYGPNENYLGSDSYALKSMTNKITYLDDGEFCIIKKDQVNFFNVEGKKINKKILELSSDEASYDNMNERMMKRRRPKGDNAKSMVRRKRYEESNAKWIVRRRRYKGDQL